MQLSFIRKYALGAAAVVTVALAATSQNNIVEEVAWVVGDQPIYKSQIEETYQQMRYERVPINGDPYCVIPEQLAIEKLYLHSGRDRYRGGAGRHGIAAGRGPHQHAHREHRFEGENRGIFPQAAARIP